MNTTEDWYKYVLAYLNATAHIHYGANFRNKYIDYVRKTKVQMLMGYTPFDHHIPLFLVDCYEVFNSTENLADFDILDILRHFGKTETTPDMVSTYPEFYAYATEHITYQMLLDFFTYDKVTKIMFAGSNRECPISTYLQKLLGSKNVSVGTNQVGIENDPILMIPSQNTFQLNQQIQTIIQRTDTYIALRIPIDPDRFVKFLLFYHDTFIKR